VIAVGQDLGFDYKLTSDNKGVTCILTPILDLTHLPHLTCITTMEYLLMTGNTQVAGQFPWTTIR